jgi:deoxycytidylate deaminase
MIINAGIKEVAFNVEYPMAEVSLDLLKQAAVLVRQIALGPPSAEA